MRNNFNWIRDKQQDKLQADLEKIRKYHSALPNFIENFPFNFGIFLIFYFIQKIKFLT